MKRYQFLKKEVIRVLSPDFYRSPYMLGQDMNDLIGDTPIYQEIPSAEQMHRFFSLRRRPSIAFKLDSEEHSYIIAQYVKQADKFFHDYSSFFANLAVNHAHYLRTNDFHRQLSDIFMRHDIPAPFFVDVFDTFIEYIASLDSSEYTMQDTPSFFTGRGGSHSAHMHHYIQYRDVLRKYLMKKYSNLEIQVSINNEDYDQPSDIKKRQGATLNVFFFQGDYYLRFSKNNLNRRFVETHPFKTMPPTDPFSKEVL